MASARTFYVCGQPHFVERFPVRTEIMVLPADEYETCSICGIDVRWLDVHCREMGDADHLALDAMEA